MRKRNPIARALRTLRPKIKQSNKSYRRKPAKQELRKNIERN